MARTIRHYDKKKKNPYKKVSEYSMDICEICGVELNEQEKDSGICINCFNEMKHGK